MTFLRSCRTRVTNSRLRHQSRLLVLLVELRQTPVPNADRVRHKFAGWQTTGLSDPPHHFDRIRLNASVARLRGGGITAGIHSEYSGGC